MECIYPEVTAEDGFPLWEGRDGRRAREEGLTPVERGIPTVKQNQSF